MQILQHVHLHIYPPPLLFWLKNFSVTFRSLYFLEHIYSALPGSMKQQCISYRQFQIL